MKLASTLLLGSSVALGLGGCGAKSDAPAQAQTAEVAPAALATAAADAAPAEVAAPLEHDDHGHDHAKHDDHGHDHAKHDDHGHDHAKHDDHAHGEGMPHRFDDAKHWAKVFDDPERDAWQRPDEVIARLVTRDDLRIADIGAGTGYFAARFAKKVPNGQVIAADIEAGMITHLTERAKSEGLTNLVAQLGTPDDPTLGAWAGKLDLVFMCNTYHHIANRPEYFRRVAALLAPGGRIAILDFEVDSPRGPPKEHKLAPEVVDKELAEAGLVVVERWDELVDQYLRVYALAPR